uniref:hypothetical protein n=1 Tax=Prevotella sp. TaxID=59823 RepID=UPI0040259058
MEGTSTNVEHTSASVEGTSASVEGTSASVEGTSAKALTAKRSVPVTSADGNDRICRGCNHHRRLVSIGTWTRIERHGSTHRKARAPASNDTSRQ